MTEAEWLACEDPMPMLEFLHGKGSDRKLRLFACACVRRIWPLLHDARSKASVEVAERFADGQATEDERLAACDAAERAFLAIAPSENDIDYWTAATAAQTPNYALGFFAAEGASRDVLSAIGNSPKWPSSARDELRVHVALVRDISGNPFRPAAFVPEWRTKTVIALAQAMYDSRDFSAMPILADALQDVGCDNADILNHCRGLGPHVRGCSVVDLVLGRA